MLKNYAWDGDHEKLCFSKYYIPIIKSYESIAYRKNYTWLSVIPVLCSTLSIIWLNESLPCWINPWNIPRHYNEKKNKKKEEIIVNQYHKRVKKKKKKARKF